MRHAWWLTPLVLLLILPFGLLLLINWSVFHSQIEAKISSLVGMEVHFGRLRLEPRWPITLTLTEGSAQTGDLELKWATSSVEVLRWRSPRQIEVRLAGGAVASPWMTLTGIEARLTQNSATTAQIDVQSKIEGFAGVPSVDLGGELQVTWPTSPTSGPLPSIGASELLLHVAGLPVRLSGKSDLDKGIHQWSLQMQVPDLAAVPSELSGLEPRGAIDGRFDWRSDPQHQESSGVLRARHLNLEVKTASDDLVVRGRAATDLNLAFHTTGASLQSLDLSLQEDLSPATVEVQDWLRKASGIPLRLVTEAHAVDAGPLKIEKCQLQLGALVARLQGHAQMESPYLAEVALTIPTVNLAGAVEELFSPVVKGGVRGEFGIEAKFKGPLQAPLAGQLEIDRLLLGNFAAELNYTTNSTVKAVGPISGTFNGRGELIAGQIAQTGGRGSLELSKLALALGPLRKEAGQALSIGLQCDHGDLSLRCKDIHVKSYLGEVSVQGEVQNLLQPKGSAAVRFKHVDLSELRVALPPWHEQIPKGGFDGEVRFQGAANFTTDWWMWPLSVAAEVHAHVDTLDLLELGDAEPLVPSGYLAKHLHARFSVDAEHWHLGEISTAGVHAKGEISDGSLRGGITIREIFSGSVQATDLELPLQEPFPTLSGRLSFRNVTFPQLRLGQALADLRSQFPELPALPPERPFVGNVLTQFEWRRQTGEILQLEAIDRNGDKVQVTGKVNLPGWQADLMGDMIWQHPPECLLTGDDTQGRKVIPLAIRGDLMHPNLAVISDFVVRSRDQWRVKCRKKK